MHATDRRGPGAIRLLRFNRRTSPRHPGSDDEPIPLFPIRVATVRRRRGRAAGRLFRRAGHDRGIAGRRNGYAGNGQRRAVAGSAARQRHPGEGRFALSAATPLLAWGDEARTVAGQFATLLAKGMAVAPRLAEGGDAKGAIRFVIDPASADTGAESYLLEVTPDGVTVSAGRAAGLFYGAMTLLQLADVDAAGAVSLPAVRIDDAPRFAWRGFMMDPARHFWTVEETKQVIDAMALHKLNTLHWHLTDDQGWRVEIKQYPKLTGIGGCRIPAGDGGIEPSTGGPRPYCGFYTWDKVREVVAYAAARHITIVPEVNVPGHATAAIAAYPELGTTDRPLVPSSEWGVFPNLINTEEGTYRFLENVIGELIPLFPGAYFHIGGDEAVKDQWVASPRVQARMREAGARTEMEMQSHLVARLEKFLVAHGKRLIGWDEILEGPLPAEATVMSWRGIRVAWTPRARATTW